MAQTFKVLLWKIYILRRRRYVITLLEIVIPLLLFWLIVRFGKPSTSERQTINYDTTPEHYDAMTFYNDEFKIAYTPSNTFTDTIMAAVNIRLKELKTTVTMVPKSSEDAVVEWLKQQYYNDTSLYHKIPGVGVIFLNSQDTSHLEYVLRTTTGYFQTTEDTLYGQTSESYMYWSYRQSAFLTIQSIIDQAYLSSYFQIKDVSNILIKQLPSINTSSYDTTSMLLPFVSTVGFTFIMSSLLRCIVEEKTSGIKEMMRSMGLKAWLNWLNWVLYTLVVYIPITLIVSIMLTSSSIIDASFFIVWILFLLFTLAFVTFIFVISTIFTNGTIAMVVGKTVWYVGSLFLNAVFVVEPDKFSLWVLLLACLWPSVPLQWGLNTISTFHTNGHPWTMRDFFDDGAGGGRVSVGLAVIMFIVDIVLYSLITWYIDSIKPGPYGRAKPLSFIFQCMKKEEYDSNSSIRTGNQHSYETPSRDLNVGIKIEHLRKTFNKGKVVAVKNVDLDIYEGNITALLGHNGAGKTTTMSILSGFFSPSGGRVIANGKNIFDSMDEFRSSLGLCPQHNLLFTYFTVLEHLIFFGMLKGLSKSQAEKEGLHFLTTLKIDGKKDELVSKLSGGMKRKLCLSIALMGNPKVLMLDEPTSGLDPESRRQVWDVLLGFRGHRTIIITTHFMEEADVLGDRIAIMDHGQVSCYGTSMFLKKLYSTGYHLDISKTEQAAVSPITRVVQEYVVSADVKMPSPTQLSYNIKSDESSQFPALFSALNNWKQDLGLTNMSLTSTTLEDVFLKVAKEEEEENTDSNGNVDGEAHYYIGKYNKVTGCGLTMQRLKTLVYKRTLVRIKSWITNLFFLAIPILLMAYTVNRIVHTRFTANQPNLLLSLSSFSNIRVAVSSDNQDYISRLQQLINSGKATYEPVSADTNLDYYFTTQIKDSLTQYERQMFAGFSYKSSYFIGGFSPYFDHSSASVLNMVANTLLLPKKSSITTYNHPITLNAEVNICDLAQRASNKLFDISMATLFMALGLLVMALSFISFPLKERVSGGKQLQLMTGVCPLTYWISTFICDFLTYLLTAALMLVTVFIFQQRSIFTSSGNMGTLVLLFILTGICLLSYAYFFSFLVGSAVKASLIFVIINLTIGLIASVILAGIGYGSSDYTYYTFLLSFNPIFAATSAFIHLFVIIYNNGVCLQCGSGCKTQDPYQFLTTGGMDSANPNGINNFLIFLVVDAVIYIGLTLIIEYGVAKKLWFLISKAWIKMDISQIEEDADVLTEKENVRSPLNGHNDRGHSVVLKVNDLGKKYNKAATAVKGVTFHVKKGECFGLLGVNGAGKTTTFKMLTGEEIPNKGDATVHHISLLNQKSKFLARIGYCPQFDAISKLLTGKEMLHVYAQLRGIPSTHCQAEVNRWVHIMGLKEYADRPCGTYSGGNKRKLSTAMAFIGEPPVVFLDEPTSGVDPVSRRKLWDVVAKCQQAGQAIVLTSHSMEECEALCSRLTIMVAGQMKCIGSAQYLKHKFGQGYTIKIKLQSSQQHNALGMLKEDVARHFRHCIIKDEHVGLLHYHIPDPSIPLHELFTKMEHLKRAHSNIEDYNVSDTTLEQVFMSFARADTT